MNHTTHRWPADVAGSTPGPMCRCIDCGVSFAAVVAWAEICRDEFQFDSTAGRCPNCGEPLDDHRGGPCAGLAGLP